MKYLTLLLFSLFANGAFSQYGLNNLPSVKIEDLSVTSCDFDSTASAQILADVGYIYFVDNNDRIEHIFEKTTRIQVLNKKGYKYGDIDIMLYIGDRDEEYIKEFTATSYTLENGEIVKKTVDEHSLYEDDVNKWWKRKKYAFSNIKEGSIIEYSYKISSPYNVHLRSWYFQHDIPTVQSKFKISLTPFYTYMVLRRGFLEYDLDTTYTQFNGFEYNRTAYQTTVYKWEMDNVPAFTDESFITTDDDYLMKVAFQVESYFDYYHVKHVLISTWENLIDQLLEDIENFGGYIYANHSNIKDIVESLHLEGKSNQEKAREILHYMYQNYKWNGYNDIVTTQTKKHFLETKYGNDADLNLLFISLLKAAGLNAEPVLLSTRNNGKVYYQYPFLNLFNYVVVLFRDGDVEYLLDATNPYLPFGVIPSKCINDYGLLVKKVEKGQKASFYSLTPRNPDKKRMQFLIKPYPESDSLETTILSRLGGYEALHYRDLINKDGEKSIHDYITQSRPLAFHDLNIKNLEETDNDLTLSYYLSQKIDEVGDLIIIEPFPINEYQENILKLKERHYPVNFGFNLEEQYITTIVIPEGYVLDYAPRDTTCFSLGKTLQYNFIVKDNGPIVQIMSEIKRNEIEFEPKEYSELKSFFDEVVEKQNEKVILKKIQ